jgi:integrase
MPADQVARRDVAARLLVIKRESGAVTAARARSAFSDLFSWGMKQGLVENNPVIGTERPKAAPPRERVLSEEELALVWKAAGDDEFGWITKLLITTAARRSEVGGIAISEIDFERSKWIIPSERVKNGKQHSLPLGSLALEILRSVPQVVGRDLLFGARADRGFTGWGFLKDRLDARLGDQFKPWTLHDIRRTTATLMCDIGVPPFVVEEILNHKSGHHRGGIIGATYNKSKYPVAVRNAVAMWDRYIGLFTDPDLYAAHKAFLATGDEQAREKASKAFHDAIAAGGGHWEDYLRAIVEGERKVIQMRSAGRADRRSRRGADRRSPRGEGDSDFRA